MKCAYGVATFRRTLFSEVEMTFLGDFFFFLITSGRSISVVKIFLRGFFLCGDDVVVV